MKITIDPDLLQDIADTAGIDGDHVRTDYSGRGMYGNECVGIVGDVRDLALFMIALSAHEQDDDTLDWTADAWAEQVAVDSMGLAEIFYFPRVTVTS